MSDCYYLVQNDDGKWEKADFYDMDNPIEALTKAYQQGRADAIDEILSLTKLNHYDEYNDLMYQSINVNAIRRLKEKK